MMRIGEGVVLKPFEVRLTGPAAKGPRISALVLRELLTVLTDGSAGALRLRVEGRSKASGSLPGWLRKATQFEVVGLSAGSTVLQLEAPAICEAAPDRFAQGRLFDALDPSRSALDLLQESLSDALQGNPDSDLYDDDLIGLFEDFRDVLQGGIDSIQVTGQRKIEVTSEGVERAHRLKGDRPPARRVRVAGLLNAIRYSDRMFVLVLDSGETLRGVAEDVPVELLRSLFGKPAIVSAQAVFKPSGHLLRLEADHMEAAAGDVSVWSVVPEPMERAPETKRLHLPQGPRTGINAIFGRWPGNEADEEVKAKLAELS